MVNNVLFNLWFISSRFGSFQSKHTQIWCLFFVNTFNIFSLMLVIHGDIHCRCAEMQKLFKSHGININALDGFNIAWMVYTYAWPKWEIREWSELIPLKCNESTWISPMTPLGRNMAYYKALFLYLFQDGIRSFYTHMYHR